MVKNKIVTKKMPKIKKKKKSDASRNFVIALSIVSMIGFANIVSQSLFNFSFENYVESLLLITLGTGLVLETSIKELKKVKKEGLTPDMLGKITMIVVGALAIVASILSLPQIDIEHPTFLAVKGIVSILAIIFIIIQTWVSEKNL